MLIVIPAWNEEEVLGDVLEMVKVEKPSFADILVVSDGSTDATADIARAAGVAVLDLPLNLGVGGAMRAGFQYARRVGYEYACQLDADGQHDPREIDTLIETASSEHADVVIGSRFAGKGDYQARGPRKWAMNLFSVILSRVCHTHLSDTTRMSAKDGFSTFTDSRTSPSTASSFHAGMTIRRRELALGRDTQLSSRLSSSSR